MESFNNKHCEYCGKILKLKFKCLLKIRKFCGLSCSTKSINKNLGHELWDKKKIIKKFKSIKNEKKFSSEWLAKKHQSLRSAIRQYWKKNSWSNFLVESGYEDKILKDCRSSYHKKIAKKILKYWREELDKKVGDVFQWSCEEDYVCSNHSDNMGALKLLCKEKILKRLKKASGVGRFSVPSTYKLISNGTGKF